MPQDASYTGWEADAGGSKRFAPAVFIKEVRLRGRACKKL